MIAGATVPCRAGDTSRHPIAISHRSGRSTATEPLFQAIHRVEVDAAAIDAVGVPSEAIQ